MNGFESLGVMLDVSRNAVMKVSKVKELIDYLEKFGYNQLMLYTEDTYEISGEPKFGYLRGRYSKEEIKEIDAYATAHGVELVPCIQTLAHLNGIVRWPEYWWHSDMDNILLVDDERTYRLIDKMFATLAECFTSRKVNIGLDEAGNLGRGKYLDKHGYENRADIFLKHLNKVVKIAEGYGFECLCWSDMLFSMNELQDYYRPDAIKEVKNLDKIPENLSLIYWDYYHDDKQVYDKMIASHRLMKRNLWVASGVWTWGSYAPFLKSGFKTVTPAVQSAKEAGVKNFIVCLWHNGAECPMFAALPGLLHAAELSRGNEDMNAIKAKFKEIVGVDFDRFLELDKPNEVSKGRLFDNPARYMLYNDLFLGIFDKTVTLGDGEPYLTYAKELAPKETDGKFKDIFALESELCYVLYNKYELGVRTRLAYQAGDKATLKELCDNQYAQGILHLEKFHECVKKWWFTDNKGYGFEVIDTRLGGVTRRFKTCKERLEKYIEGELDKIEELEEDIQDYEVFGRLMNGSKTSYGLWRATITANNI